MTSESSAGSILLQECKLLSKYSILEKNGGKAKLMALIQSESAVVREQALLAVQKLMIHNWQTLG